MAEAFNVYCDESCHLEHDHQRVMVLGAVWCPADRAPEIAQRLREIRVDHGLATQIEVKWTKVSPAALHFYRDLLDYFFDDDDLHFRAVIVPDKGRLDHAAFGQTHDDWYYKMWFEHLKLVLGPGQRYRVYLDQKDTHGGRKVARLHDVLCDNAYDFDRRIIERVQIVRSLEVQPLQLADFLTGIISYANRGLQTSTAKLALVQRMRERSHYELTRTTLLGEQKVNLLVWEPRSR